MMKAQGGEDAHPRRGPAHRRHHRRAAAASPAPFSGPRDLPRDRPLIRPEIFDARDAIPLAQRGLLGNLRDVKEQVRPLTAERNEAKALKVVVVLHRAGRSNYRHVRTAPGRHCRAAGHGLP
jgi:hypothetical protein